MIFYLKGLIGGRVVLSPVPPTPSEDLIQEIEAKHWVAAREQTRVSDFELYAHRHGYGYFQGD